MTDDEKALHVSLAVGALETVRKAEADENPTGLRARVVKDLIDRSLRVTDLYRMDAWPVEKLNKAWEILDETERRIKEVFGAAGSGVGVAGADSGAPLCHGPQPAVLSAGPGE